MRKMYWVSVLVVLSLIIGTMWMSSNIERVLLFMDLPGLIMVIVPTFVMLLASFSMREIRSAFSVAWQKSTQDPNELKSGLVFFKAMSRYLLISAVLVFIIGFVGLLSALSDTRVIGRNLGLALLCIFYSILLQIIIAFPFAESIRKKLAELGEITK